ncbi:hypothetical protein L195_g002438 [Trifolium pratense]|uniref:Uncharacterized protein n=1 Tax=Trifolium pratense TaxID=57577 RepID=A0A2K3NSG5_TRIPR|nr:hypothetical protein L195_g002438 [Trifolium pratense]
MAETTTVEGTEFGVATECCVAAIMEESASGNGAVLRCNSDRWWCRATTIVAETTTVTVMTTTVVEHVAVVDSVGDSVGERAKQ